MADPSPSESESESKSDPVADSLLVRTFSVRVAVEALRGEVLPQGLGRALMRRCVISGIRHHEHFALGPASALRGTWAPFTRALNARLLMSNVVPDMGSPDEVPYCFWHPVVPAQETLRALLAKIMGLDMAYQVGRACAVAGYTDLYNELDILPEVGIAEEARESGSMAIYDSIMRAPVRYRVFDDYTRTINSSLPQPAVLNGDTAVVRTLDIKQPLDISRRVSGVFPEEGDQGPPSPEPDIDWEDPEALLESFFAAPADKGFDDPVFDIAEDANIGPPTDFDQPDLSEGLADSVLRLLHNPLPVDLPVVDKDLLIYAAAYYGSIDRYIRLRRPARLEREVHCIIRGIYHNPLFARWWADQDLAPRFAEREQIAIDRAITARYIMSNDLSRLLTRPRPAYLSLGPGALPPGNTPLPYQIWYPSAAMLTTYRTIADKVPEMYESVARAAIYIGDRELFDRLVIGSEEAPPPVKPNGRLYVEAKASRDPYFCKMLLGKGEEAGLDLTKMSSAGYDTWLYESAREYPRSDNIIFKGGVSSGSVMSEHRHFGAIYDGFTAGLGAVELYLMIPERWKPKGDDEDMVELDYGIWWPHEELERHSSWDETRREAKRPSSK